VLAAMAVQTLDFGRPLAALGALRDSEDQPITLQQWLDEAGLMQLDAVERDEDDEDDDAN
jgi:hypothetical protein